MKKSCPHGLVVPKNLRCHKGYLELNLFVGGRHYCRTFGEHTRESQKVAETHLADKKKEIFLDKFEMSLPLPRKKFYEVAKLWFSIWKEERYPDGSIKHNEESCYKVNWTIERILVPSFGNFQFDEVRAPDIANWRSAFMAKGRSGITANRYQAILGSIFSHIEKWVKTERIKPAFQIPKENPCKAVEMAPQRKRERILTKYEAKKLRMAFTQLNDLDGWDICKMALKSVLSLKDLKGLEIGQEIDLERSKTGVPVNLPITVLTQLNFKAWRNRWERARALAGLSDLQFRDLRKTGINWLKGRHDLKLISEYAGHSDIKTTQRAYTIKQSEYLAPLASDLEAQVDEI